MICKYLYLPFMAGVLLYALTASAKGNSDNLKSSQSLRFIQNVGQIMDQYKEQRQDIDARLHADNGLNVFVGDGTLHYQWIRSSTPAESQHAAPVLYRMDVQLIGANTNAVVSYEEQQKFTEQYYTTTVAKNHTAQSFARLRYKNIYPNIDWVLYTKDGTMKYDFIVHPGGKVSDIKIRYSGATAISLQKDGSLSVKTPMGVLGEQAPVSFTREGKAVGSRFILSDSVVSFAVDDYSGTLVIDPELSWSTYFGGTDKDIADAIAIDPWGNTYISGYTLATDNIATTGAFQTDFGGSNITNNAGDAFIAKFNCAGEQLWATYYGGESAERAWNVVADNYGNIYFAGFTNLMSGIGSDDNLATAGSHQPAAGGGAGDLFLVKMDSAGNRIWATYYGGSGTENSATLPVGLALDNNGHVYLAGTTNSTADIATADAYQISVAGGNDAFLVQFDTAGTVGWATYYGSTGNDRTGSITCDASGDIYLTGITNSASGIASSDGHQVTFGGGNDGFLVKFDNMGGRLWATYYGGTGTIDEGMSLYCDTARNIYLAGRTNSSAGISSTGAFQPSFKGGLADAFLAKFDSSGNRLWGTYYGGINNGAMQGYNALDGDNHGGIFLTCLGRDTDSMATEGAYRETAMGNDDGVLARFTSDGDLDWATYYGGATTDLFAAVRTDGLGNIYLAGGTMSDAVFATEGSHQDMLSGGYDAFLLKFSDTTYLPSIDTVYGPAVVCSGSDARFYVDPVPGAIGYTWTLPSGWSGSSDSDSITVTVDTASGSITVSPVFPCNNGGSYSLMVEVVHAVATPVSDTIACAGDTLYLKATSSDSFLWQWMMDGSDIPGAVDSMLAVNLTGIYQVIVSKEGCADTSAAVSLLFHDLPLVSITMSEGVLNATPGFADYQWQRAGTDIMGAVSSSYTPALPGLYTAIVVDANGCTATSEAFDYSGETSISNTVSLEGISIYPNPATNELFIDSKEAFLLQVLGADGRVLLTSDSVADKVNISSLSPGIYLLQLYRSGGRYAGSVKFIKL